MFAEPARAAVPLLEGPRGGCVAEGNEGDNVHDAEPGVNPVVGAKVDEVEGEGAEASYVVTQDVTVVDEGEDTPVMVGVAVAITEGGTRGGVETGEEELVSSLGDVDHALEHPARLRASGSRLESPSTAAEEESS